MANDDQILLTFAADVNSYEKAIDRVEQKTLGLDDAVKQVGRTTKEIGKGNTFAALNKGLKETSQEATKTSRSVKEVGEESKKTGKAAVSGFIQLRNELKAVKGQMAELAVAGKEGTEEFKKLQIQAGALQDQMKDLGTSIQLNAGDPLENLSAGFGSVRNSISSLDFDGVSRGLGAVATNISRVNIDTFKDGLGGVAQNFVKIGAALITNPIFLVGAAVTGIIAAVISWGDSMEETAAKNDKAVDKILRSLEATTAEYDRQIKLQEALGQNTERAEDKRTRAIIRSTKQAIEIKDREIAEFEKLNKKAEALGIKRDLEDVERFKKLTDDKFSLEQQLFDARNDLRVNDAERQREADEKAAEEAAKQAEKNKAFAEKRAAEILAAQKALEQSRINLIQDSVIKQLEQIEFDFDQRINAIKGNSQAEIDLRKSLEKEKEIALSKVRADAAKKEVDDIQSRQAFVLPAIKELTQAEIDILLFGARTRAQIRAEETAALAKDIEQKAAFANSLVSIGTSVTTLLAENQAEAAEKNKLFSAFGIGLNLATSLSQMIAGAAAAAAATGPLAPFTLVGYIAQGTALVLGAFAQIKSLLNAPVPKAAAHGEEWVRGKQYGKDTEHYMLAHGERVVTSAVNEKYWDELHAMHTGKYENYINERRILPALRKAMLGNAASDSESFAQNVANSIMLGQSWRGSNIVEKLGLINQQEGKRHTELVNALRSRSTYRKK